MEVAADALHELVVHVERGDLQLGVLHLAQQLHLERKGREGGSSVGGGRFIGRFIGFFQLTPSQPFWLYIYQVETQFIFIIHPLLIFIISVILLSHKLVTLFSYILSRPLH